MAEQRLRIVAADDEPDMRDFFVKVLAHLGHDVVAVAADGSRPFPASTFIHLSHTPPQCELPSIS